MKRFTDLRIRSKLLLAFVVPIVLLVAAGAVSALALNALSQTMGDVTGTRLPAVIAVQSISDNLSKMHIEERTLSKSTLAANKRNVSYAALAQAMDNAEKAVQTYSKLPLSEEEKALFISFQESWKKWKAGINDYLKLNQEIDKLDSSNKVIRDSRFAELDGYTLNTLATTYDDAKTKLDAIVALNQKAANTVQGTIAGQQKQATLVLAAIVAIGALLSVAFALLMANFISAPLRGMVRAAEGMARGELAAGGLNLRRRDEIGLLNRSFSTVTETLQRLIDETGNLTTAAAEGRFQERGDETAFQGSFARIIQGINGTLDVVVDKVTWYEELLDNVPLELSVTDRERNLTFINRAMEERLGVARAEALGQPCAMWNKAICGTERCGIECLARGEHQTQYEQDGASYQVDAAYVLDAQGETIGHIEIAQDITARARVTAYLREEVDKLTAALAELAQGSLTVRYEAGEGDAFTAAERESFLAIGSNLQAATEAIRGYIARITDVLGRVADGNFGVEEVEPFRGDFADISHSLNVILASLNDVFEEIAAAADQVADGSRQMADGSQTLSQGATEQASAIEALNTVVGGIAGQTRENAANALEASDLAHRAMDSASIGNDQMTQMLRSMDEINEASASIARIIKVIDDIAFQTNLLALNAAVEAAHAGQHGKGFAVVAEEVRSLAARSADAARETTDMIEGSIRKAEAGTRIANGTAEALRSITTSVEQVNGLLTGIAAASNDQATSVSQVNRGIEQVAQVLQTTSATAEQTAATSEELSGQAEHLSAQVGRVRLRGRGAAPAPAPHEPVALPEAGDEVSFGQEAGYGKY